jgi:methyltransferase-like protein
MDFEPAPGGFDYIICHGVYSWVPEEVKNKILSICRGALAPQGIGYVSFNTYPGWHMRESTRHMMRYHAARFSSPEERVTQARNLLSFLVSQLEGSDEPYALLLKKELMTLHERGDDYLFHEHLEAVNTPCYFYEFAENIDRFGLQYLGDADLSSMLGHEMPEATRDRIGKIAGDILQMEQYLDFVRNRQFRMTLVCHKDIMLKRSLDADSVRHMRFMLAPSGKQWPVDLTEGTAHTFATTDDRKIHTRSSLMKAAIETLMKKWPESLSLEELVSAVSGTLAGSGIAVTSEAKTKRDIAAGLLQITGRGGVALRTWAPPFALDAGEFPKVRTSSIVTARRYGFVTNAYHDKRTLSQAVVQLTLLLNGERDREQLLEEMVSLASRKAFTVTVDGKEVSTPDQMRMPLSEVIESTLDKFAQSLLLISH